MNFIKNVGISILYTTISILVLTLFISILSYFNIIGDKAVSLFKIFTLIISLFIGGIYIGKKSTKKGWLEGLKLGLIFLILLIIFNLFMKTFTFKNILYYIIIIISSIFGSMVGISIKKTD